MGLFFALVFWLAVMVPVRAAENAGNPKVPAQAANISPTNGLGSWIWAAQTFDRQTCQFWREFEIPSTTTVTHARLVMTVDDEFELYLDGRNLGHAAEWRELDVFNLTPLLTPGQHVLAVKAFNSAWYGGMILGMRVDLADGRVIEVKSDKSWRVAPANARHWETKKRAPDSWPAATIIAPYGSEPWWTVPVNINMMPTLQPIRVYFWQTGWFLVLLASVCGVVILISLRLMAQIALHRKEQWLLQGERARIARDIHDDIGARMTQLVLHGEVAQSDLPAESDVRGQIEELCQEARELLSTMDEILWAVNPQRDTLRDFSSYVCNYAQAFLKRTSIQCLFEVDPEMSAAALALPLRRSLLMAIKETLNNAVKYSQATELRVAIQRRARQLVVVVQDNGKGFDPATVRAGRHGLSNMAQRMKELGGSCQIASRPGQGCRVELCVSLAQPRRYIFGRMWRAKWPSERNGSSRNPRAQDAEHADDPSKR